MCKIKLMTTLHEYDTEKKNFVVNINEVLK